MRDKGIDVTEAQANQAAAFIAVIGNAMRVRMTQIMLEGELPVGDLANRIGLSHSATSQHLKKLKMAGMLIQRKDEQSRYCTISKDSAEVLRQLILVGEAHQLNPPGNRPRP